MPERHGENGPQGDLGAAPKTIGQNGSPGHAPAQFPEILSDRLWLSRAMASAESLEFVLHSSEMDYLNGNFPAASEKLAYVLDLSSPSPANAPLVIGDPGLAVGHWDLAPFARPPEDAARIENARRRALLLRAQMSLGLDFFGHPAGYVDSLAQREYIRTVTKLLELGVAIERDHDRFWNAVKLKQDSREVAAEFIDHHAKAIENLRSLIDLDRQRATELQGEIFDLGTHLLELEVALRNNQERFRAALRAGGKCTDFGNMVKFVGSVVAVAKGAGGLVAAASAASDTFKEMDSSNNRETVADIIAESTSEKPTGVVVQLKKLSGSFEDAQRSFNQVSSAIQDMRDSNTKLVMEEQDFNKLIDQHLDLEAARDYKAVFQSLFATAKNRNDKMIQRTAALLRAAQAKEKIEGEQKQIAEIRKSTAEDFSPHLEPVKDYLTAALARIKVNIIWCMDRARRSLEFWSLREVPLQYSDDRISTLSSTLDRWLMLEQAAVEARGQLLGDYEGIKWTLQSRADDTDENRRQRWTTFKKSGVMAFELLPEDGSAGRQDHLAVLCPTTFDVEAKGLPGAGGVIRGVLTQTGRSIFVDPDGGRHVFTHPPRPAAFTKNLDTGIIEVQQPINDRQEQPYIRVSQFGTWRLSIVEPAEEARQHITEIVVHFKGTTYSRRL